YFAPTGGVPTAMGTSYTTPTITVTKTYYVAASNNGCTTTSRTAVIASVNACVLQWIGVNSIDWNTGSNWSYGLVPTSTDSVIVPISTSVPFSPTISTSVPSGKLTINTGGQLTLASGGTLNSYGNIINNGMVTATAGSAVIFAGNTAQSM